MTRATICFEGKHCCLSFSPENNEDPETTGKNNVYLHASLDREGVRGFLPSPHHFDSQVHFGYHIYCKICVCLTFYLILPTRMYHIQPNYLTCPYKHTVKQFCTFHVLFVYFFIKAYVVGTHLNCNSNEYLQHMLFERKSGKKKKCTKTLHKHHLISPLLMFFFFFFFFF